DKASTGPGRASGRPTTEDHGYDEHHQEDHEENLRDTRGGAGDTTEAQNRGDDGDDQECNGPTQHDGVSFFYSTFRRPARRSPAGSSSDSVSRLKNMARPRLSALPRTPSTAISNAKIRVSISISPLNDWG